MNYKIVIDAGHGGEDSGAVGNGIIEKDLNLKIANYMYDRFKSLGIPVKIIRSTDETISPNERVNRVLNAFGNSKDVIVISNHINAGGGDGAEVIYPLRSDDKLPNLILNELEKEGQNIRKAYQRRYPSNPNKDYYFMQRNTGLTQTLTVEYGFLDSTKDDVDQLKNNYERYAEAVVRAVLEYIGVPYNVNKYTVKKGDTLYSISNKYNVSVNELKQVNNLTKDILNIGQNLIIPTNTKIEEVTDYETYIVNKGDSLYSIAKKFNVKVDDLIKINNLTNNTLSINQQLLIPQGKSLIEEVYSKYVVKLGDTLYSISNKYGISVDKLKEINNLTSNVLYIGQVLNIPYEDISITNSNDYITYVVNKGDTLYKISNNYNISQSELMDFNDLTNNILSIGQIIKIPTITSTNRYIVKKGDSLYSIAKKFNKSVDEIKSKNNLTSNLLKIGQVLII